MNRVCIYTRSEFDQLIKSLEQETERIVIDTETTGLNPYQGDQVVGISIYLPTTDSGYYVHCRHIDSTHEHMTFYQYLIGMLNQKLSTVWGVGFNFKFDLKMLMQDGLILPPYYEEIQTMSFLLNENEPSKRLKALSDKYLGEGSSLEQKKLNEALDAQGLKVNEMGKLPAHMVAPYAIDDVVLTWKLRNFFMPHLDTWELTQIYHEYNAYDRIVCKAEHIGVRIDIPLCEQYISEIDTEMETIKEQMSAAAGYPLNPNSSKQVCAWLGIESSRAEVIDLLLEQGTHPNLEDVKLLSRYRALSKVNSTYFKKFIELADGNGVLHPNFRITGTVTGRASCSKPNLQALPRLRDDIKWQVKDVIKARDGYTLISSDLSQAELRLLAVRANIDLFKKYFQEGHDFHSATAEDMGIPRSYAKRINFSVVYGIGAKALSESLNIPRADAKKYLDAYHTKVPEIRAYSNALQSHGEKYGYIKLWNGRLKHFPTKDSCHKALSNDIQGGVADMIRISMTKIGLNLETMGAGHTLLQVHDDIISEVKTEMLEQVIPMYQHELTSFDFMGDVPLLTDTAVGQVLSKMEEV